MKKIEKAFKHVKKHFPTLAIVVFNKQGQWCYMDENFNAFDFENSAIEQSILEDASDEVEILPFIYQP